MMDCSGLWRSELEYVPSTIALGDKQRLTSFLLSLCVRIERKDIDR